MCTRLIPIVCSVLMIAVAASRAGAQVFASSGFNDGTGLNADATPGSPYTLGQTVAGRGAGEPGWGGTWFVQNGGAQGGDPNAIVRAAAAREGDGGMELTPASFGSTRAIRQLAEPLTRRFVIEQDVNFGAVGGLVSGPFQSMLSEGDRVGPQWGFSGPVGARRFQVFDGNSNQLGEWEDTGIAQRPGEWQHVVMDANVATQTFTFSVDGVTYNPPDPIGFFNAAAQVDHIDYFTTGSGYVDGVIVRAVPEPGAFPLAGGLAAFALRRRRSPFNRQGRQEEKKSV
jgi:hypothetical protein